MLPVTCAIIQDKGQILICQRSSSMKLPLKWEFPGGKIEDGEQMVDCLRREIREELDIEITVGAAMRPVEHHYPDFSIVLYPFLCTWSKGTIILAEHAQALWVELSKLKDYDWAEADKPIVQELLKL